MVPFSNLSMGIPRSRLIMWGRGGKVRISHQKSCEFRTQKVVFCPRRLVQHLIHWARNRWCLKIAGFLGLIENVLLLILILVERTYVCDNLEKGKVRHEELWRKCKRRFTEFCKGPEQRTGRSHYQSSSKIDCINRRANGALSAGIVSASRISAL